ncbi:MAG: hypothetical protein ACI84K_000200 [Pseudohongiellaceae bacterium]|jgi:hypothetical protein
MNVTDMRHLEGVFVTMFECEQKNGGVISIKLVSLM